LHDYSGTNLRKGAEPEPARAKSVAANRGVAGGAVRRVFHHRAPFDRMLVAQSLAENLPMVSSDDALDAYRIKQLW
jgi:PIN domain nuclease of toxin-antitoxin system